MRVVDVSMIAVILASWAFAFCQCATTDIQPGRVQRNGHEIGIDSTQQRTALDLQRNLLPRARYVDRIESAWREPLFRTSPPPNCNRILSTPTVPGPSLKQLGKRTWEADAKSAMAAWMTRILSEMQSIESYCRRLRTLVQIHGRGTPTIKDQQHLDYVLHAFEKNSIRLSLLTEAPLQRYHDVIADAAHPSLELYNALNGLTSALEDERQAITRFFGYLSTSSVPSSGEDRRAKVTELAKAMETAAKEKVKAVERVEHAQSTCNSLEHHARQKEASSSIHPRVGSGSRAHVSDAELDAAEAHCQHAMENLLSALRDALAVFSKATYAHGDLHERVTTANLVKGIPPRLNSVIDVFAKTRPECTLAMTSDRNVPLAVVLRRREQLVSETIPAVQAAQKKYNESLSSGLMQSPAARKKRPRSRDAE